MRLFDIKDTLYGTASRNTTFKPTIVTTISNFAGAATGMLLASKSDKAAKKAFKAMAVKGAAISAESARRAARFPKTL